MTTLLIIYFSSNHYWLHFYSNLDISRNVDIITKINHKSKEKWAHDRHFKVSDEQSCLDFLLTKKFMKGIILYKRNSQKKASQNCHTLVTFCNYMKFDQLWNKLSTFITSKLYCIKTAFLKSCSICISFGSISRGYIAWWIRFPAFWRWHRNIRMCR